MYSNNAFVLAAMIVSGSIANFIDHATVLKLQLLLITLHLPHRISTIDCTPILKGTIHQCTWPVSMDISSLHHEFISHLVMDTPKHPIILSIPWLQLHNPWISWIKQEITKWSENYNQHCLQCPHLSLSSTCSESPNLHVPVHIPMEYHMFRDVFSQGKARGLSPHRPKIVRTHSVTFTDFHSLS